MKSLPLTIADEILAPPRQPAEGTFEHEPLLWEGPANHFRGIEARGGWLRVTPTRLAFRSHGLNVQNQPFDIARTDIVAVQPIRLFGIFITLQVTLTSGRTEKFVVWDRQGLIREIEAETASKPS